MPFPTGNRNLYNFRTIIGDHSRAHLFQVNIPAIGSDPIEMSCFARTTKLPQYSIQTTDIAFQGLNYKVATSAEMGGDWECEFLLDDAHEIRLRFLQWMGSVYDPERQVAGSPLFYKSDNVTVSQLNRIGEPVFVYQFVGLFPKTVGEIALDHGNQDPEKFTVTFSYDYFAVRAGAGAKTGSIPTAISPDIPFMGENFIVGASTGGLLRTLGL
jgi:hypothetical protein